jgi:hypothetical protein
MLCCYDAQEAAAGGKPWKMLGAGVIPSHGGMSAPGGVCSSADGLHFAPEDCVPWPAIPDVHWDSWWNLLFDEKSNNFVATSRASNDSNPCRTNFYPGCLPSPWGSVEADGAAGELPAGSLPEADSPQAAPCDYEDCYWTNRAISRVRSAGRNISSMGAGGGNEVVELGGGPNDQLYVQATFASLNVWLGVVMVYEAATYRQEVHCRLVWSADEGRSWRRIEPHVDLVPLGDEGSFESHICYGSKPVVADDGTIRECGSVLEPRPQRSVASMQLACRRRYYFGGDGPH